MRRLLLVWCVVGLVAACSADVREMESTSSQQITTALSDTGNPDGTNAGESNPDCDDLDGVPPENMVDDFVAWLTETESERGEVPEDLEVSIVDAVGLDGTWVFVAGFDMRFETGVFAMDHGGGFYVLWGGMAPAESDIRDHIRSSAPDLPGLLPECIDVSGFVEESASVGSPTSPEPFVWPFEDGPDRYAVIGRDGIQTVGFAAGENRDIPNIRVGVIIGDALLFGLDAASGTWIWPARPGMEMEAPGGQELVSLLIGQTGTETSTWFQDASVVDGRPTILYREIESETDPIQERMMLYDLESGETFPLFDKLTRGYGVSQEEREAPIGDAALASDRIATLFALGDSTWIEWYDLGGNSIAAPESLAALDGSTLEIAIADDKMVLGVETELNRLITHLWVVDLRTGHLTGPIIFDTDGQSVRGLTFDGRWLTATIIEPSGEPVGSYFVDTTNRTARISKDLVAIAPARG